MTEQLKLAKHVASILGLPPTWPNLRTIEIALICETAFSSITLKESADLIVTCARTFYAADSHMMRYFPINRFFFEDAAWRETDVYRRRQFEQALAVAEKRDPVRCWKCDDAGEVWNQGAGPRRIPCPDCGGNAMRASA